jgi:hypothetical protein
MHESLVMPYCLLATAMIVPSPPVGVAWGREAKLTAVFQINSLCPGKLERKHLKSWEHAQSSRPTY